MGKIRIYTNESVNIAITEGLKRRGIKAWSAKESGNLAMTDEEQLSYATQNKAVIFTHDDDFLKLAIKWSEEGKKHWGIIYAHQQHRSIGECIKRLRLIVDILSAEDMKNHIEFF